jgi:hypothetical protein
VIAALNRAGLNLPVSAQIAYFAPFHSALYEIIDPYAMLVDRSVAVDPQRDSLPLRRPRLDWFDQSRPARAESDRDWVLKIYDGRYVGINYGPKPTTAIFGDLRNAATRFVAWVPLHQVNEFVGCAIEKLAREFRQNPAHAYVAWEDPAQWSRELNLLGYAYEHHGENDPLRIRAAATVPCSLFTTNINVSLAIRKALRRYLGIEPAEGES